MRELHKRFPPAARVMGVTTRFSGPFRSDVSWDPTAKGFAGHSPTTAGQINKGAAPLAQ